MTDSNTTVSDKPATTPVDQWGRDHWSTFGYIETRIVDHAGVPDVAHMRCDPLVHPAFALNARRLPDHVTPPTRLAGDATREQHDDWSCLDDAEAAGLLTNVGTGLHRVYKLTETGERAAAALRSHKAKGGRFSAFRWAP